MKSEDPKQFQKIIHTINTCENGPKVNLTNFYKHFKKVNLTTYLENKELNIDQEPVIELNKDINKFITKEEIIKAIKFSDANYISQINILLPI